MLKLTDQELAVLTAVAARLPLQLRSPYLEAAADVVQQGAVAAPIAPSPGRHRHRRGADEVSSRCPSCQDHRRGVRSAAVMVLRTKWADEDNAALAEMIDRRCGAPVTVDSHRRARR
jgi:hypothetical protein